MEHPPKRDLINYPHSFRGRTVWWHRCSGIALFQYFRIRFGKKLSEEITPGPYIPAAPTNYILGSYTSVVDRPYPHSPISQEVGGLGIHQTDRARSSDNASNQFTDNRNYQHHGSRHSIADPPQAHLASRQPQPANPPHYCASPCSNSTVPDEQRQSCDRVSVHQRYQIRQPGHVICALADYTTLSGHPHRPNLTDRSKDPRVQSVKLAQDLGRGGDDRHQERPPNAHGDPRRPDLPQSHFNAPGPMSSTAPPAPFLAYWGQPGQPPPGFGPYDRPISPPRPFPYPPQHSPFPTSYLPPSPFPPPLPAPYPAMHHYPPVPAYGYPSPLPTNFPPRLPNISFAAGPVIPGEVRPPPDIPGVLPPAPFFGPPKNPKLILPPGTQTDYKLIVRQQPERARMCGFGEKDRRPIDPPPIVEVQGRQGQISQDQLQKLVLQCTLWNEEGTEHRNIIRTTTNASVAGLGTAEELPVQPEEKHARVMMGNIFANAMTLEDDRGRKGFFYIFADLSIRVEGRYRLKFDLLLVDVPPGTEPGANQVVAEMPSDIFVVFAAKKFPGMMQSTELTKAFARQGVKISVRGETRVRRELKPSKKRASKRRASMSPSTDEDDDDDDGESTMSSETKRKRMAEV